MKIIPLKNTNEYKNSNECIATEYTFCDNDIDVATAIINGEYPKSGYCVNTKVKEIIYVVSGNGKLVKENEEISFSAGDAILIEKGEKYRWNANCKIVMCCSPAWTAAQHIIVEN